MLLYASVCVSGRACMRVFKYVYTWSLLVEITCWLCIVFVCRTEMWVVYSVHESMFDYVSKCVGGKDFLVQICVCECV